MIRVCGRTVPCVAAVVRRYRNDVSLMLKRFRGVLEEGRKVICECVWRKSRRDQDCCNFHDELLDAVCPALGINDRDVLLRDMDFTVEPKNPGVWIQLRYAEAVKS